MSLQLASADLHHLHLKAKLLQKAFKHSGGTEWAAEQRQIASGCPSGDDVSKNPLRTVSGLSGYCCSAHLPLAEELGPSSAGTELFDIPQLGDQSRCNEL